MKQFEDGFYSFIKASTISYELSNSIGYVAFTSEIESCITKLVNDLNLNTNPHLSDKAPSILKGDIAEFFHGDTFNLIATINQSNNRVNVERSTGLGSVDATSNFGKNFSLKYNNDGTKSAKEQAVTFQQRYALYTKKNPNVSFEEFLAKEGITTNPSQTDSIYSNQVRIVARDVLQNARDYAKRKAQENLSNTLNRDRNKIGETWNEVYELLDDRLRDNEGNESIPLSNADATKLAILSKDNKVTEEDLKAMGIDLRQLVSDEIIIQQALQAGLTSAVLSLVMKIGPEIIAFIYSALVENKIDYDDIKKLGKDIVCSEAEAFVRGGLTAALTVAVKTGRFNGTLKELTPSHIGAAVVIAINAIRNTFLYTTGRINRFEVTDNIVKDSIILISSLVGGSISQAIIKIPLLGYLIGNFVGAVVGTVVYTGINTIFMTLCIDTGITLFGLVTQDYILPDDVFNAIGAPIFKCLEFKPKEFKPNTFLVKEFSPQKTSFQAFSVSTLRRGVISVGKIGYI